MAGGVVDLGPMFAKLRLEEFRSITRLSVTNEALIGDLRLCLDQHNRIQLMKLCRAFPHLKARPEVDDRPLRPVIGREVCDGNESKIQESLPSADMLQKLLDARIGDELHPERQLA